MHIKRTRFTEQQITFILEKAETVTAVAEVVRKMGISEAAFYNWKKKFGGLRINELRWLKQLEDENAMLKKIVEDLSLDKEKLQDV